MSTAASSRITVLRPAVLAFLIALAVLPFLFTPIPPLTDVPGHIGRFSVQTAALGDGLWRYFSFRWTLTLNLASDVAVQALHPLLGVVPATWLLCAATPALTVVGIVAIARATNRSGAYALPWALLFVFSSPFLWGFLNFALTEALALIAFAAWISLAGRRRLRTILFLGITPMLIVGHGVAGIVGIAMIVGYDAWAASAHRPSGWDRRTVRAIASTWPPVLAGLLTLVVWKTYGASGGGVTMWLPLRKLGAVIKMLRDQNETLDIGTVACAMGAWLMGVRWGARLAGGPAGAVIAVVVLFLAAPSLLSGSDEVDTRIAPLIPMLAFAMQDWSRVDLRRRRAVLLMGFALLGLRYTVTLVSFVQYGERYRKELSALNHITPGARVLNLTEVDCDGWRSERLEHLGNLATTFRHAWVNSHWSVDGLHLLQISYRPSAEYYDDPSQMVFPARCVDPNVRPHADYRANQTAVQALRSVPLRRVDFLWVIGTHLPLPDDRLRRIWRDDISALYAVRPGHGSDLHSGS